MKSRKYKTYEEYIEHQKWKWDYFDRPKHSDDRFKREYTYQFLDLIIQGHVKTDKQYKVLCLGARRGWEVWAWRTLGFDAIGIDIQEYEDNPYVVYGDFHDIPFPDGEFDYVFSNALDHSLYPEKFISEADRVLKLSGKLLLEIRQHTKSHVTEDVKPGGQPRHEVLYWEDTNELIKFLWGTGKWKKITGVPVNYGLTQNIPDQPNKMWVRPKNKLFLILAK